MTDCNLTGSYRVRVLKPALHDAKKPWPGMRDRMELRRQALKLRFWPNGDDGEGGVVLDLDWCWIRAVRDLNIGELRITDRIGGHENIRIIFFVGDKDVRKPLPVIWVLLAMVKKREDFSTANIATFKARRLIVLERFYRGDAIDW